MPMNHEDNIGERIRSALAGGDLLVVVPPFSRSCRGAILDPHTLEAMARARGLAAEVLYLNVLLAAEIGVDRSEEVSGVPRSWILGERLFARAAHGLPALGAQADGAGAKGDPAGGSEAPAAARPHHMEPPFDPAPHQELEAVCAAFVERVAPVIAGMGYRAIWFNVDWEQLNCSLALIDRIRQAAPDTLILMGGLSCEMEMAEGVAALSENVDHLFPGEPEPAFERFLGEFAEGGRPAERILGGEPVEEMDRLPLPRYDAYFDQVERFLGDAAPAKMAVAYESSRGCWKGQKQRCAFCGLSCDVRIRYRHKSAGKVAGELAEINRKHPGTIVFMADHTPPPAYYRELFPNLSLPEDASVRYQLVATLGLEDLVNLRRAGVNRIQPGIEALATPLLDIIHKGVKAHQNLLLLRNAMSADVMVYWYLLWGIPGDNADAYERTLELLPLIVHLQPPELLAHVRFERFGLYVRRPDDYGIRGVRPEAAYGAVFPPGADIQRLAHRFVGEYPAGSHDAPELIERLAEAVARWKERWREVSLAMVLIWDQYVIHDSRGIEGTEGSHLLTREQAAAVMGAGRLTDCRWQRWAIERKLAVAMDGHYVPLVTASPELLRTLAESKGV